MKKHFRAWAMILSLVLFFNTIYSCKRVYALTGVEETLLLALITGAVTALGKNLADDGYDYLSKKLGWREEDIRVDENGNYIISQAQMEELQQALEEYTQDANGKDKYGMYLYESDRGYTTVEAAMIAQTYNLSKEWNRQLVSSGTGHIWVRYVSSVASGYASFAPNGAVWIAPSSGYAVTFYNQSGTGFVYTDYWSFSNNDHTWSVSNQVCTSAGAVSIYGGPGHVAFETIEDYRAYIEDGSPYTLVAPTYTGGNLVITPDDLQNPDLPGNPDFDDDGTPVTEKGWLQRIYERLGDILDQIKQIKWISVVDTIINAVDAFGDDVVGAVASAADAVTGVLSEVFPLCIFWDIILVVHMFEAEPLDPVFEISIDFSALGIQEPFEFTIDLTEYDAIWSMLRVFEVLFFIAGLWKVTLDWVGKGDDV